MLTKLPSFSSVAQFPRLDAALPDTASALQVAQYWKNEVGARRGKEKANLEAVILQHPSFPTRLEPFITHLPLPTWGDANGTALYDPISTLSPAKSRVGIYSQLTYLHSVATTESQRCWLALAAQVFGFGDDVQEAMIRDDIHE